MPLSVLIPAPVMATTCLQSLSKSATRWASAETLKGLPANVGVDVNAWKMTRRAVLGRMRRSRRSRQAKKEDNKEPSCGIPCVSVEGEGRRVRALDTEICKARCGCVDWQ